MSLLDDVSIVVTPNGYKAGTLYGVLPTYAEGSEELNNTDFATETVWTFTNVDFSVGAVLFDNDTDNIFQSFADTVNTQYKLTITKTGSGTLRFRTGFAGSAATKIDIPESGIVYFTSTSDTNRIQIYGDVGDVNATLNSVSVKEVTSADMDVTRATAATRVDEDGLVNYAEVLGSEEITNGDFATNLDSWSTSSWWVWNSLGAYHPSTSSHKPLYQQCCVIGKTYLITFDLNCIGSSQAKFSLGSSTGSTTQVIGTSLTSGSYSYFVTAAAEYIVFNRQNTAEYYVNNVSVKEAARDNVPRIDYTGGGCPHILAEPQSTNEVHYSVDFRSNSTYDTDAPSSVFEEGYLAPDGTNTATRVTGFDGYYIALSAVGVGFNASYNKSLWIKSANSQSGMVHSISRHNFSESEFQVTPEWQRIDNKNATESWFYILDGRGTQELDDVIIWGLQATSQSYPTSYIPTSGSTVTRNQDIFTRDGIGSLINSEEGVLFVEMAALSNDGTYRQLTLNDGTTNNRILVDFTDTSNQIRVFCSSGSVSQVSETFNVTSSLSFNKIAFKWKLNDFALWVNGVEVATDTSGITPIGLNKLSFNNGAGSFDFYGKVRQLQVYNTALSDEQLLQLTGESGTDFYESYAEMASALTYTIQ